MVSLSYYIISITLMSSLCPGADDVDILGIFLKSFGAVIVFFCLAASICHSFRRGCFHKKGHNENKWVETTLAKERRNVGLSLILDHIQDFFFYCLFSLFQLQLASTDWWCWLWRCRWGKQSVLLWVKKAIKGGALHTNFAIGVFHRAIFATSLHSSFDSWAGR